MLSSNLVSALTAGGDLVDLKPIFFLWEISWVVVVVGFPAHTVKE